MTVNINRPQKNALPIFRQDLQLFQGPEDPDGSPTYSIFDPVKGQYYRVSWAESLIIKSLEPGMTVDQLCEAINKKTTLKITPQEVKRYFEEAARHNLLAYPRSSELLSMEAKRAEVHPIKWLIFHYLYIRIPLVDPNEFLKRTYPYVKPLTSNIALCIYAFFTLLGLGILFTRMEEFLHTFQFFFTPKGIFFYAISLTAVKVVHELAHAYTAIHYKVRVPSIGVALLVLWPVLYTDVTDGWKLAQRRHRMAISLAGIMAETIIAGLCTFGWAISTSELASSVFFVIASSSWISTILVNANPAMRYDGYYIACDLLRIDNLQNRAFGFTRWKMRELLFGMELPCPEHNASYKYRRRMVIYTLYTWNYRLALYTTIAVFVYYSFTKVLGTFLFFLEIGVFLIWPVLSELEFLIQARKYIKKKSRIAFTALGVLILIAASAIPYSKTESYDAVTVPEEEQTLYVTQDSVIEKVFVERNQDVKKGELIATFVSRSLDTEFRTTEIESRIVRQKIKIFGLEDANTPFIAENMRELEGTLAKKKSIEAQIKDLSIKAEFDGSVINLDDDLWEGMFVSKDQIIGKIANTKILNAICYIPESSVKKVKVGDSVTLIYKEDFKQIPGKIESISPMAAKKLFYPSLASINKGSIAVLQDSKSNLMMVDAYYTARVVLEHQDHNIQFGRLASVELVSPSQSFLETHLRSLLNIFIRESGF